MATKPSSRSKVIAVTGASGMLGAEVIRQLRTIGGYKTVALTQEKMDITDVLEVKKVLGELRPHALIHCAAFTQVDTAEKEPQTCNMVNAEGTKNLAFFCRELNIDLIYISTDYVFDGTKGAPYLESDPTVPINTYGRSKELGEKYVAGLCERYKIVRTSWLNGLGGTNVRNFIETMLRLAETRSTLSVVNDQVGKPTFTFDLAKALILLLEVKRSGIFHVTNSGQASWYEFACEIIREAGLPNVTVQPISSEQFRSLARRPRYSVLENSQMQELGLEPLPDWRISLREYMRRRKLRVQALTEATAAGKNPTAQATPEPQRPAPAGAAPKFPAPPRRKS